jgi:hypothetical protein
MDSRGIRGRLKTLGKVYLVSASTVFLFLLLELGTRGVLAVNRAFRGSGEAARAGRDWREEVHPVFENANYPAADVSTDPRFAGWRIDPPDGIDDEGRKRILFLGGSTTANDYPARVRKLLEPEVGPVTVYNLAASWHTSLHSLQKYVTYADAIRPDLVIVLHNINDFYRGFTPPGLALPEYRPDYSHHAAWLNWAFEIRPSVFDGRGTFAARVTEDVFAGESDASLTGLLRGIARGSTLVHEIVERVRPRTATARGEEGGPAIPPDLTPVALPPERYLRAVEAFRGYLTRLRRCCEADGVPVVFVTMPFTTEAARPIFLHPGPWALLFSNDGKTCIDAAAFRDGMRKFNDVVRSLDDAPGGRVLDLAPEITDPALFRDEVHLFDDGRQQRARVVADFVRKERLLGE